jgi:signal peptidase I
MSVAAPESSHFSPWLTVWWKPRVTIERIVAANPKHHVLLLAAIGGVASLLTQLIFADFAIELVDWRLIAIGSIAAAIFGVVSLYIAGVIFAWSGRLLGGHASPTTMRAVLAWGPAPSVIALAICLIVIGGLKLSGSAEAPAPTFQQLFAVLPIIAVAVAIWSIIMTMLMLARIQRFGFWRTVAGFALGEVLIVVVSLVLALVIRSFLFQPFNAPSGSMKPTLLIGDYFFVSKFSYGYTHYSLPFSPKLFSGRIVASEPKLGDVVVFRLPKDDSTDYIKRIVGLPGDRIQMINGHLHINGEPVKREQIDDLSTSTTAGVRCVSNAGA